MSRHAKIDYIFTIQQMTIGTAKKKTGIQQKIYNKENRYIAKRKQQNRKQVHVLR